MCVQAVVVVHCQKHGRTHHSSRRRGGGWEQIVGVCLPTVALAYPPPQAHSEDGDHLL